MRNDASYWDTSAILNFYVEESDSAGFLDLFTSRPEHEQITVGFLHQTELFYSLRKKEWKGYLDPSESIVQFNKFQMDVQHEDYHLLPWSVEIAGRIQGYP